MTVCLRPTTELDLDFVLEAEQDAENSPFVVTWTREQHQEILSSADAAHCVVERVDDNTTVGYLIMPTLPSILLPVTLRY